MEFMYVMRRGCRVLLTLTLAVAVSGCGHIWRGTGPDQEKPLDEVVDALQYAIEKAAESSVWKATEVESRHWNAACVDSKSKAAAACFGMLNVAEPLCRQVCNGPNCGPIGTRQCERYMKGENVEQLCNPPSAGAQSDWCTAARSCAATTKTASQMCENAGTIAMPELLKADVALSVERKREVSAGINILIVSFGGGRAEVSSNVINMTLKPRVRDEAYGSSTIKMPDVRQPSAKTIALAEDLARAITDAVAASTREFGADKANVVARGPVMVSDLQVTFSLVVDVNGKLGIKKAWGTPVGLELEVGGGMSTKRANSITVTYSRPK